MKHADSMNPETLVVVIVQGGCIQHVVSSVPGLECVVVDWDEEPNLSDTWLEERKAAKTDRKPLVTELLAAAREPYGPSLAWKEQLSPLEDLDLLATAWVKLALEKSRELPD